MSRTFLKTWWIAVRPFAFPASVIPVLLGTAAAVQAGGVEFHLFRAVAALGAMMLLHAGSNLISDGMDFRRGLDRETGPVSGAVVRGWLSSSAVIRGGLLLTGCGALIGLVLAWLTGPVLLLIGAIGMAGGLFYSRLKYIGLGDLTVLLVFGVLGTLGAWTVQTGSASWIPVCWSLPFGLLVTAILHANNWRDQAGDAARRVMTPARLLGGRGSRIYYGVLLSGPFLLTALFGFMPVEGRVLPWTAALVFPALVFARRLWRQAVAEGLGMLDAATAQFSTLFGFLYLAGLLLALVF